MNFWAPIFEEARRYQQEFVDNLRNFLNTLDDDHADQWHNQLSSLLWRWELRGLRITDRSRKVLYDLLVEIAPPGVLERALLARLAFQKQLAEKAEMQAAAKRATNESAPENRRPATVLRTSSAGGELVAFADDLADATANADASATDSAAGGGDDLPQPATDGLTAAQLRENDAVAHALQKGGGRIPARLVEELIAKGLAGRSSNKEFVNVRLVVNGVVTDYLLQKY